MCGILVYTPELYKSAAELEPFIRNRGPDYYGRVNLQSVIAEASVLSLREPLMTQPVHTEKGCLCYNGQTYFDDPQDTLKVYHLLSDSVDKVRNGIESVFECEGGFAFVYILKNTVYFARDRLGRRSLLYKVDEAGGIIISSVGTNDGFVECEAFGTFYTYELDTKNLQTHKIANTDNLYPPISQELRDDTNYDLLATNLHMSLLNAVKRRLVLPTAETAIGVLFSGGLDCSLLTALIDDTLPVKNKVFLINVAFENRRTNSMFDTPDRLLARNSFKELQARSQTPDRLHLIEIDVPYEQACSSKQRVAALMYPNATVMDLSIALAFYYAASTPASSTNKSEYPRILFSGLGADELFAGYSRHTSLQGAELAAELNKDFSRLPHRNLGRDDRVISDQAKDVRYPFLDSEVVNSALQMPLDCKCVNGETKIILRHIARKLSLPNVSTEKKRAIQFGARSAKMDPGSGNCKGVDSL